MTIRRTLIAGDAHLSHRGILKNRPQFHSIQEHDEYLFSLFADLTPRDQMYCVGDWAFTPAALERFSSLPFRKILVLGNHDAERGITLHDLLLAYDDVVESVKRNHFTITHRPMHPAELRGRINVHAHGHDRIIRNPRYISVSFEATGFRLVDFEEIRTGSYRTFRGQHDDKQHAE